MIRIDIVAALRSEESALPGFVRDVAALGCAGIEFGMVFVEDSSEDGTLPLLRSLSSEHERLDYYALKKGYGQGPAIVFGLTRSKADAMIMMDADGSHPVSAIPEMVACFRNGAQIVQCTRRSLSGRPRYRSLGAAMFTRAAALLSGVDVAKQNIYYRLVTAEVATKLIEEPLYWTFLRFPLEVLAQGKVDFLDVDTRERALGESKYHVGRLLRLAVDALLAWTSERRLISLAALACVLAALLAWFGAWPLAAAVLVAVALLVRRCLFLRSLDILGRMVVSESSRDQRSER